MSQCYRNLNAEGPHRSNIRSFVMFIIPRACIFQPFWSVWPVGIFLIIFISSLFYAVQRCLFTFPFERQERKKEAYWLTHWLSGTIIFKFIYFSSLAVYCGPVAAPINGEKIIETSTFLNGEVKFRCIGLQFKLVGDSTRKCLASGQWSGTQPTCQCMS